MTFQMAVWMSVCKDSPPLPWHVWHRGCSAFRGVISEPMGEVPAADLADKIGRLRSALACVDGALAVNDFRTGCCPGGLKATRAAAAALVASAQHPNAADEHALAELVVQADASLDRITAQRNAFEAQVVEKLRAAIAAHEKAELRELLQLSSSAKPPFTPPEKTGAEDALRRTLCYEGAVL